VSFEPARRFKLDGTETTDMTHAYVYPLAGLPHVTTVDQTMFALTDPQSPIEDAPHSRRTRTTQDWAVQLSAGGRPFPVLAKTTTESFSRQATSIGDVPFEQSGFLRTFCRDENLQVDSYGNVTHNKKSCVFNPGDENGLLEGVD